MRITQSEVVRKLIGRGFIQGRKHDGKTVYMSKRVQPWKQVLALVGSDGSVNGTTLDGFLVGANL